MQGPVHRPKLVIFDFDGTLADSGPWVAAVLNDVAARHRFRAVTGAEMAALREQDARTVMRTLGVPGWRVPLIVRDVRARMASEIHNIRMFDGVAEMLNELRRAGLALAVASTNSEANVRTVLGPAAAAVTWFECGTALFGKARRLRRLLRRTGIAPEEALYVGDEVRDAEAASAAGMAFGAVAWGYNTPTVLRRHRPAWFFATPGSIGDLLGQGADEAHTL